MRTIIRIAIALAAQATSLGCVGSFEPANTAGVRPSTTRTHCVVLDSEHNWGMTIAAVGASLGTGLGTTAALETDNRIVSRNLAIGAAVSTAVGLGAGALGLYASASYHNQCVEPALIVQAAPATPDIEKPPLATPPASP
jgi:hypothetical protein